jgi:hypothetical protein
VAERVGQTRAELGGTVRELAGKTDMKRLLAAGSEPAMTIQCPASKMLVSAGV